MIKDLKDDVITKFSLNATQEWYVKSVEKGLWGSEEIMIRKYFKPNSTILDIGCGTGRTTICLHELGYKVTGQDITPAMIKSAKEIAEFKKLKIKYEVGDVTNLKYKYCSFDNAIFSFCGWNQIPGENYRINALKEVFRILKPGGHFILISHTRKIRGFTIFWTKQWLKLYILNPLGFNIKEIEFGDYFYNVESTNESGIQKQYVHMPRLRTVRNQIAKAGFDLVFIARADSISNNKPKRVNPMFFVCKKTK